MSASKSTATDPWGGTETPRPSEMARLEDYIGACERGEMLTYEDAGRGRTILRATVPEDIVRALRDTISRLNALVMCRADEGRGVVLIRRAEAHIERLGSKVR